MRGGVVVLDPTEIERLAVSEETESILTDIVALTAAVAIGVEDRYFVFGVEREILGGHVGEGDIELLEAGLGGIEVDVVVRAGRSSSGIVVDVVAGGEDPLELAGVVLEGDGIGVADVAPDDDREVEIKVIVEARACDATTFAVDKGGNEVVLAGIFHKDATGEVELDSHSLRVGGVATLPIRARVGASGDNIVPIRGLVAVDDKLVVLDLGRWLVRVVVLVTGDDEEGESLKYYEKGETSDQLIIHSHSYLTSSRLPLWI